jgi:hypothetical protein
VLLYVLEHQRTVVWFMALRLLRYLLKVWEWWLSLHPGAKTLPAVIPVVLHQGAKPWDAPRSLAALFDLPPDVEALVGQHVPGLEYALQDLGAASATDLAAFPGPPLVRVTLSFMRAIADPQGDPLGALDHLAESLRALLTEPGGEVRLATVLRYTVLARPGLDVRAVANEFQKVAGAEAGEVVMSTVQELIEQGIEKGIEKGIQQGIQQTLELLLTECFGPVTQEVKVRIGAASPDELRTWTRRVPKARTLEDVFAP